MATDPFALVNSRRGAPIGRGNFGEVRGDGRLVKARWVDGDYDQGGAYWGYVRGESIYAYVDKQTPARYCHYVRAKSEDEAYDLLELTRAKVVFRKWVSGNQDVFALLPGLKEAHGLCVSYQHVGQHSAADYQHCISSSTPASTDEYAELQQELEGRGYHLSVIKRYQRHGSH